VTDDRHSEAPPETGHSLADRLGVALRRSGRAPSPQRTLPARRDWRDAALLALAIAAAPLLVWAGTATFAARIEAATADARAALAPEIARRAAMRAGHAELARIAAQPGAAATLEHFAAALPEDAMLVSVRRGPDGLEAEIATPDPDRLRTALRGVPALSRLRETGQARGEATMRVTLAEQGR